jgi:ligand-binding sensor protein
MSRAERLEPCPYCGKKVSVRAPECPYCGEQLEDAPPAQAEVEATDFLIPTNVSGWAIVSCYAGLIGFCLPIVGLLFAVPAVICGIVALRKPTRGRSYGAVTSNARAIIGLVLGSLGVLG